MIPMELNVKNSRWRKEFALRIGESSEADAAPCRNYGVRWTYAKCRLWRRHDATHERRDQLKGHPTVQLENTFAPGDT